MQGWFIAATLLTFILLIASTIYSGEAATQAKDGKASVAAQHAQTAAMITGISAGLLLLTFIGVLVWGAKKQDIKDTASALSRGFMAMPQAFRAAYYAPPQ